MSQVKPSRKCKTNFNIYIPPPARKAENVSQHILKKQEYKDQKVAKVKTGEKDLLKQSYNLSPLNETETVCCSTKTNFIKCDSCKKLSVDSSELSDLTEGVKTLKEKQRYKNKVNFISDSDISSLNNDETTKDSDCLCSLSNALSLSENPKDINHNQNTVRDDFHKNVDKPLETEGKSHSSLHRLQNDTAGSEEENEMFRNLWVKLSEHENLETKVATKTHKAPKVNEVNGVGEINENCILEIYDFPAEFKTSDLHTIFSAYISKGMKIRWVDDTHALGIYPSEIFAYQILHTDLPFLKTRTLNEGIPQSRDKAKLLLPPPPPPRPVTCSASARRLVSGALGIKAVFTREEIEEEKKLLKVAREQKLLAAKQRGLKTV